MPAFRQGLVQGFREIWINPFRTILTMAAVAMGVAALVAMTGVLESMLVSMTSYNTARGGMGRIVVNDQPVPAEQKHLKGWSNGRTLKDAAALERDATLVRRVSPQIHLSWQPVAHGDQQDWAMIHGVTPAYAELYQLEVADGRFLSGPDVDRFAPVCVIGAEIALQVFPPGQPVLGRRLRIGAHAFTVIGVLKRYLSRQSGRNALWQRNWTVWIPLTTAQQRFTGTRRIDGLEMEVADLAQLVPAMEEVENIVRPVHRWVRDFKVENQLATLQDFGRQQARLRASLGGVAAISLVIGGIGVMSVMLAGVNDRIREIGVRKSLGAQHSDIFLQFLCESVGISFLGGLAGMAGGVALVRVLATVMIESPPVLVPGAFYLGTAASVATGILAGLYPALRAAALEPIEALRAE